MQTICLRSVFAGKNVKVGSPLISFSRRLLSNSAVHSQEVELERPKGVPLATDLGGVKVKPSVKKHTNLAEKLRQRRAEIAKAKSEGHPVLGQTSTDQKIRTGGEYGGSQKPYSQAGSRPPSQGNRRPGAPGTQRRRTGDSREGGVQSQANRTQKKKRIARPKAFVSRNGRENADPDLDDYAGESPGTPRRIYDDNGHLRLKGQHAQLCQTIKPTLPKLSLESSLTGKVTNPLGIASYSDRAPPKTASEPSRNVLGTVDNAELALSRIRELKVPVRRDAIGIVRKIVEPSPSRSRRAIKA